MFLLALAALGLTACSGKDADAAKAKGPPPATVVTLRPAETHPLDIILAGFGTLRGDEEVTLAARVGGRVTEVRVDAGDRVDFAGLLAQIDPVDYRIALEQAKASLGETLARLGVDASVDDSKGGSGVEVDIESLPAVSRARGVSENAERTYQRNLELFNDKPPLISAQVLADYKTAAETARSAYRSEQLAAKALLAEAASKRLMVTARERDLAEASVRAPTREQASAQAGVHINVAGTGKPRYMVARRMVSVGEHVTPGQPLFRIFADSTVKAVVGLPERELGRVNEGMSAMIVVEGVAKGFPGTVRRVNRSVNEVTRMFEVEVVADNASGELRPGSFVRADITVGHDAAAVFVPVEAVLTYIGMRKVFTVAEGRAVEHVVELGPNRGGLVQVAKGLGAPAEVIVTGGSKLSNGSPVSVRVVTPENVPTQQPATGAQPATGGGQ